MTTIPPDIQAALGTLTERLVATIGTDRSRERVRAAQAKPAAANRDDPSAPTTMHAVLTTLVEATLSVAAGTPILGVRQATRPHGATR